MQKRLQKEIGRLLKSPPEGVVCYPSGETLTELEAKLQPMCDPYEQGTFRLSIVCGDRYPNEPPSVRFTTPVYHPNIDSEGRICLNLLKMPPKGCWAPSYGIASVLSGIQILLAQPNPDDPLMTDITEEYRSDHQTFLRKAREHTLKYATADTFEKTAHTAAVPSSAKKRRANSPAVSDAPRQEAPPKRQKEDERVVDPVFEACPVIDCPLDFAPTAEFVDLADFVAQPRGLSSSF